MLSHEPIRHIRRAVSCGVVTFLLCASGTARAADDDAYLRAIREEGNKLEFLNRAKEEIKQSEQQEIQAAAAAKPGAAAAAKAKNITEFEKELSRDAPASHKLYTQLTAEKRLALYNFYLKDGKMSAVKRKIVEFYLGA
jgi:hypothetical protein